MCYNTCCVRQTKRKYRCRFFIFIAGLLVLSSFLHYAGMLLAVDKPVIGALGTLIIEPYGVKVDARIDTGASTTSLDARN